MKIKSYCEKPLVRFRVDCEGNASFCHHQNPEGGLNPYIGNLLEDDFEQIWFGEIADEVRHSVLNDSKHAKCSVTGCPFNSPFQKFDVVYNEYPTHLEIDLPNTKCNIGGEVPTEENPACIMCKRSSIEFKPQRDKLTDVLLKLKNIVPNLVQIDIQGFAEPFHERLIFDVLDVLGFDDHCNQIKLTLMTNGTLLSEDVMREYLSRVPNSVTNWSLDAATPEVYSAIRFHDFELVLKNLYSFASARNSKKQFLLNHNNINVVNVKDVEGMVHIASQINAEHVEFNPTGGHNKSIIVNESNCGMFYRAQKIIERTAKELGVNVVFLRPLDLGLFHKSSLLT